MITVYTREDCPACKMLKTKLDARNIPYKEETDTQVLAVKGIATLPVLEVNGELLTLGAANKWVNEQ